VNYARIALAALGAFAAYFVFGFLTFGLLPSLRNEFLKYPAVYRPQSEMMKMMPLGMGSMLLAFLLLGVLYALAFQGGSGVAEGARFGILIGLFFDCVFVLHNYVNLNIGLTLTIQQAVAYLIQWTLIGLVIGLIYRPAAHS